MSRDLDETLRKKLYWMTLPAWSWICLSFLNRRHLCQFYGCGFDRTCHRLCHAGCDNEDVGWWKQSKEEGLGSHCSLPFHFLLGFSRTVGQICLGLADCCMNGTLEQWAMLFKTLDILRGAHLNLTYLYIMKQFLLIPWTWVVYQIPIHMLSKNTGMGHACLSQMPATRETLRHFLCLNISLEPSGCSFVSCCDWMNIVTMVDINDINTVLYIRKHSFSFKSQRWKALEVIFHGYPTLPPKENPWSLLCSRFQRQWCMKTPMWPPSLCLRMWTKPSRPG